MLSTETLKSQLTPLHGIYPLYRLRWRFDYLGNKPSKIGIWNDASPRMEDRACFVNKDKLIRAAIEGERIGSWATKVMYECSGQFYISSQWIAAIGFSHIQSNFTKQGDIIGLSFTLTDRKIFVYRDGRVKQRFLTEKEKEFKILEHSLGV